MTRVKKGPGYPWNILHNFLHSFFFTIETTSVKSSLLSSAPSEKESTLKGKNLPLGANSIL